MQNIKTGVVELMFLFILFTGFGQTKKLDSVNNLIKNASSDTQRIRYLNWKIDFLSSSDLDSCIRLALSTLALAQKINYYQGEFELRSKLALNYSFKGEFPLALQQLNFLEHFIKPKDTLYQAELYADHGVYYGIQSKYDSAIIWFTKSMTLFEGAGATTRLPGIYGNIAISYQQQSNLSRALFYQQKSLSLSEKTKDEISKATVLVNIGNTYEQLDDHERAKESLLAAIEIAKRRNLRNVELYSYTNLASLFTNLNQPEEVYKYSMKAADLAASYNDKGIEAASLSKAATALSSLNRHKEAEVLALRSIKLADSAGQPLPKHQAYASMGTVQKNTGDFKKAIPYYEKSFAALEKSDLYTNANAETAKELSECYEKTGNLAKALETYKKAADITDSVRRKDNIQKSTELRMNYEFEKTQAVSKAEQDKKDSQAIRLRNQQLFTIAALGILVLAVLIIAFIQFRSSKHKHRANLALQHEKEKVESTLTDLKAAQSHLIQSEKMASLGSLTAGIAHEIQNPLNFVNNFSEVSIELIEELKSEITTGNYAEVSSLAGDIKQNLEKIMHHGKRADSIVKGMLQHSRANTGQAEATNINALADEYFRLAYHGVRAKDKMFNASLETDFDERISTIKVVPQEIGRVILNLVNNAFYAVGEKAAKAGEDYHATVSLSTKKLKDTVEIVVSDNGYGIPKTILDKIFQPFFTTKPTGEGTGLGLSLSYDIIKAHGGELKVETKEGDGTSFKIILPVL